MIVFCKCEWPVSSIIDGRFLALLNYNTTALSLNTVINVRKCMTRASVGCDYLGFEGMQELSSPKELY